MTPPTGTLETVSVTTTPVKCQYDIHLKELVLPQHPQSVSMTPPPNTPDTDSVTTTPVKCLYDTTMHAWIV